MMRDLTIDGGEGSGRQAAAAGAAAVAAVRNNSLLLQHFRTTLTHFLKLTFKIF